MIIDTSQLRCHITDAVDEALFMYFCARWLQGVIFLCWLYSSCNSSYMFSLCFCHPPSLPPRLLQGICRKHKVFKVPSTYVQLRGRGCYLSLWEGLLQGWQRSSNYGLYSWVYPQHLSPIPVTIQKSKKPKGLLKNVFNLTCLTLAQRVSVRDDQ